MSQGSRSMRRTVFTAKPVTSKIRRKTFVGWHQRD